MARFNIQNKAENLLDYIMIITEAAPKKLRFDLIPQIRITTFNIFEDIIRANSIYNDNDKLPIRATYQENIIVNIKILEGYLEMCASKNYITAKQFEYSTKLASELNTMIINWKNSDLARLNNASGV